MEEKSIKLLERFENAVEKSRTFFRPGFGLQLKRLISNPKEIIIRNLDFKILKHKYSFWQKAKLFYGVSAYVQNYEQDLLFFGFLNSGPEIRLTKYIIKTLKPDNIFYEIGANLGFYSLLARELLNTGEVHSFEPSPMTFNYLGMNCRSVNIFLNNTAVSDISGDIDFYDASGRTPSSISTISSEVAVSAKLAIFNRIKAGAVTLDDYCQEHKIPTFLKIDVEGAEFNVLSGAKNLLKYGKPIIAMEIWSGANNTGHIKAAQLLKENNFKLFRIKEDGTLQPMEDIQPDRDIAAKDGLDNFIFKKSDNV